MDQSLRGQLSLGHLAPWTKVSFDNCPLDKCIEPSLGDSEELWVFEELQEISKSFLPHFNLTWLSVGFNMIFYSRPLPPYNNYDPYWYCVQNPLKPTKLNWWPKAYDVSQLSVTQVMLNSVLAGGNYFHILCSCMDNQLLKYEISRFYSNIRFVLLICMSWFG